MLAAIPTTDLARVWPTLWPMLEPAIRASVSKPNILAALYAREAELWAIVDDGRPIAAIVTQVQATPEPRCLLWMIGGSRVREWAADFMTVLIYVARAGGCVSIVGAGRRGWARIVKKFGGEPIDPIEGSPAWRLAL